MKTLTELKAELKKHVQLRLQQLGERNLNKGSVTITKLEKVIKRLDLHVTDSSKDYAVYLEKIKKLNDGLSYLYTPNDPLKTREIFLKHIAEVEALIAEKKLEEKQVEAVKGLHKNVLKELRKKFDDKQKLDEEQRIKAETDRLKELTNALKEVLKEFDDEQKLDEELQRARLAEEKERELENDKRKLEEEQRKKEADRVLKEEEAKQKILAEEKLKEQKRIEDEEKKKEEEKQKKIAEEKLKEQKRLEDEQKKREEEEKQKKLEEQKQKDEQKIREEQQATKRAQNTTALYITLYKLHYDAEFFSNSKSEMKARIENKPNTLPISKKEDFDAHAQQKPKSRTSKLLEKVKKILTKDNRASQITGDNTDEDLVNQFILAYHVAYEAKFFTNPFSKMKKMLKDKSKPLTYAAIESHAKENEGSRTAKVWNAIKANRRK